ncbi:MAG: GTP 3',8-cyclase MoaA [Hyphomonadaceae bacterium]|nr:GTP 3',8-cyclase MoaA [Hyphomonadaceae bacterium]
MKIRLIGPQEDVSPRQVGPLRDGQGRTVSYLRLSVTDRCDLRCTYCMPERMSFLPKSDILSFEELLRLVDGFIARGITKLRITGGEPLVRRDVMLLLEQLSHRLGTTSLREVSLTTNATRLEHHAEELKRFGIERINVSLDTLSPETFAQLTRKDQFTAVMRGIERAREAGLRIKINTVALRGVNEHEIAEIVAWAHGQGFDMSLIETMPLGEEMSGRSGQYLSLQTVRARLAERWSLEPITFSTGGPSRYVRIAETGGRLGFISPLSHNFCDTCNRVRVTCTGMLYTCLGHEGGVDLRDALRAGTGQDAFDAALDRALIAKPARHDFSEAGLDQPATRRTMSVTGG